MRRSLAAALLVAVAVATPAVADPVELVDKLIGECMDCVPSQIMCVTRPCDWLDPGRLVDTSGLPPIPPLP